MNVTDAANLSYHNLAMEKAGRAARTADAGSAEMRKLKSACQDFEAIFIKQMLDTMRKTVNKGGLLDGGMAEEVFEDMLYDEYAAKMSRTASLGVSDMLYRELSGRIPEIKK